MTGKTTKTWVFSGGIGVMALVGVSIWYATAQPATTSFKGRFTEHPPEVQALIERTLANMVFVEGGDFMMGNVGYEVPEDDPNGEWLEMADGSMSYRIPFPGCEQSCYPVHKVTLSGYYIHKYETTIREYDLYTKANDLPYIKADQRGKNPNMEPDRAVYLGVDWHAAQDYCLWLADLTGLPFDLPTEAQWEYAARSRGQAVKFATDTGDIDPGVNYEDGSGRYNWIDPVGLHSPNPLGLYDMTGNANEWVRDWYSPFAYEQDHRVDPTGPPDGDLWATHKLSRGFGRGNSNWNGNLIFRRIPREIDFTAGNGFRCAIHSEKPLESLLVHEPASNP